jgi:hypothetical protein
MVGLNIETSLTCGGGRLSPVVGSNTNLHIAVMGLAFQSVTVIAQGILQAAAVCESFDRHLGSRYHWE